MRRVLALACIALTGCTGIETVMPSAQRSAAAWSSMIYAAKDGPILVEVHGGDAGLAARAAQAMTGAVIGYPTRFTADPAQAPHRNFRAVLVIDPATTGESAACQGRAGHAPRPGRLRVLAVFCNDLQPLSSATGSVAAASLADPAVPGLLRSLARETFREEPVDRDDRDGWDF